MRTIHVEPGSELDLALQEAAGGPVVLERRGVRYRLSRLDAAASGRAAERHDPATIDAALRDSAGALAGVDVNLLLADLAAQREQAGSGRHGYGGTPSGLTAQRA